jgi:hypothetical protein
MKTYKVDLDYEASLFDPLYKADSTSSKKIIREFEYVFFLVNREKCALKNFKDYEIKYLENLQSIGFVIPELNPNAEQFDYWWGFHHDKKTEQLLNSKLTSARLARENGWGFHEGAIVSRAEEVTAHLCKFPQINEWLIKKPHSFSGIGHYRFKREDIKIATIEKVLSEACLLEPVYERLFDIGTTFFIQDKKIKHSFMVENFNSSTGGFLGGAGAVDVDKFKKYFLTRHHFDLTELERITVKIAEEYLKMGAVSNVQIDSFIYRENGQLKLYPLVEVNYRKTMGLVIQSLAEKFTESDYIEWRIEPAKTSMLALNSDWIQLSPQGNHFLSYLGRFLNSGNLAERFLPTR